MLYYCCRVCCCTLQLELKAVTVTQCLGLLCTSRSHLHARVHSRRKCASGINSLCQQDNLDLVKTVKQDGRLEFMVLRQDYM